MRKDESSNQMKNDEKIPINKGNYSMDTVERETRFHECLAEGWEDDYKKYRANWINYPRNQFISDYPLLVDLELASVCNLKCPMCYTTSSEFKTKVNTKLMDYELYTRLIDEISGKVPAIRLSLRGEATLHKKFVDCISYAKKNNIKEVSTLTHGAKLKGQFLTDIIDAGIDWITVSIDGVDEVYENIRKPVKFSEIYQNIKNIHEIKRERNLNKPVIKVQGIWPAIKENPSKYYEMFSPYVDLVAYNPLIDYLGKDSDIKYVDEFLCPQQYQRLVIGADGLVMKCSNDEENREVIGDVNKQSIHDIWHGKKMTDMREMQKRKLGFMESPVCRKCYLPRQTTDNEKVTVAGKEFVVLNYLNRIQKVGC